MTTSQSATVHYVTYLSYLVFIILIRNFGRSTNHRQGVPIPARRPTECPPRHWHRVSATLCLHPEMGAQTMAQTGNQITGKF
jgi:hypothetical protein